MVLTGCWLAAHVLWRAGPASVHWACSGARRQKAWWTGGLSQAKELLPHKYTAPRPPETRNWQQGCSGKPLSTSCGALLRAWAVTLVALITSARTKAALPERALGRQPWPAGLCQPNLSHLGMAGLIVPSLKVTVSSYFEPGMQLVGLEPTLRKDRAGPRKCFMTHSWPVLGLLKGKA